jgi:hypothetical protein
MTRDVIGTSLLAGRLDDIGAYHSTRDSFNEMAYDLTDAMLN